MAVGAGEAATAPVAAVLANAIFDATGVRFLPDSDAEFTSAMGMLVDKSDRGFGKRSWRYSMLVKDGVVAKMFIEPEKEGDPLEVSDADTMLKYINSQAVAPEPAVIFAKPGCPHCARAKALLESKGYRYDEISLGKHITSNTLREQLDLLQARREADVDRWIELINDAEVLKTVHRQG